MWVYAHISPIVGSKYPYSYILGDVVVVFKLLSTSSSVFLELELMLCVSSILRQEEESSSCNKNIVHFHVGY